MSVIKNYFRNKLSGSLINCPALRIDVKGKLIGSSHTKPAHQRAMVFGYDNPEAGLSSLDCPVGVELMADSAGLTSSARW